MKKHVQRVLDHVWGPVGSIILHLLILLALFKFVRFVQMQHQPDVEVVIMEADAVDLDELLEPEELEDMPELIEPPDIDLSVEQPSEVEDFDDAPVDDFEALEMMADVQSPLVVKGLFAGRSASGRAAALNRHNARYAEMTERAVLKALEWLRKNQDKKTGSWGTKGKTAMTGLGLLTFLAHGETPGSEEYGPTVEKAIRCLIARQKPDGWFVTDSSFTKHGSVYEHSVAAYAVSEAYAITRIPALKPVMENATAVIVKGQQKGGGWDYHYKKGARNDLSVDGWHVQALKAAAAAGAGTPGLKAALKKAVAGVKALHKEDGQFGYSTVNLRSNLGLTGVGVLSLQLLGHPNDKETQEGLKALNVAKCKWTGDYPSHWPMYGWYYISQAKFHHGHNWDSWNRQMAQTLAKNQNKNGSWPFPTDKAKAMGYVYSTTMAALTLQVYYRFLPTYQADAVKEVEYEETDEEAGDVEIEII